MTREIRDQKSSLRHHMRAQLKAIPPSERADASVQACELLTKQETWQRARSVLFYAPLADELDCRPLWEVARSEGKIVVLPRFAAETETYEACEVRAGDGLLSPGKFGILEPGRDPSLVPLKQLDLILVPGVAFDMSGRRLGRGKGFYDRLLKDVRGPRCGVAFDLQIQPKIPVESHDILLNFIVTPTRWLSFAERADLK